MRISIILFFKFCLFFLFVVVLLHKACSETNQLHENYDQLMQLLAKARQDTDRIKLQCEIGLMAKTARSGYWDSILKTAHGYNMFLYESRALLGLSMAYLKINRSEAWNYLDKSIELAEQKGYKREAIMLIESALEMYSPLERKQALDLNYKGLKLAEELNDKRAEINFYSNIATRYFLSGDIGKSLKMHLNCLKLSRELNYDFGIASALVDIGSDYHALKDEEKAIAYYLESGSYAEKFAGTIYAGYIYISVASAYEIMSNPDNSKRALYATVQSADSAIKYSRKAQLICESLGNKTGLSSALVVLAKATFQKGDLAGAKRIALEAMSVVNSIGFVAQIPDLALFLKKIYIKEKDFGNALKSYELYVTTRDSIAGEKARKQDMEREFAYNYEKKENENKLQAQQIQIQLLQLSQSKFMMGGLCILLLLVLVIAWLFIRQNKLKAGQKNAQLEQKLLRAQMNPHFIFNSLTAIQQFIISKQNESAERYLSRFSKLMRELLESNIKENITVKEEADILTGYIEMESLRFGKSFSYSIVINEKINADHINIPHMMIQPFVENAIWHGLLIKEGHRELNVAFNTGDDRTLICIIDDNGVGREVSMKKKNTFKKKSLALSFVKQRLRLMSNALKVNCKIDIVDKADDHGQSLGTKIILVLPILKP